MHKRGGVKDQSCASSLCKLFQGQEHSHARARRLQNRAVSIPNVEGNVSREESHLSAKDPKIFYCRAAKSIDEESPRMVDQFNRHCFNNNSLIIIFFIQYFF